MPGEGLSGEHGCPLPGGTVGSAWWSRLFGRVSGNLPGASRASEPAGQVCTAAQSPSTRREEARIRRETDVP